MASVSFCKKKSIRLRSKTVSTHEVESKENRPKNNSKYSLVSTVREKYVKHATIKSSVANHHAIISSFSLNKSNTTAQQWNGTERENKWDERFLLWIEGGKEWTLNLTSEHLAMCHTLGRVKLLQILIYVVADMYVIAENMDFIMELQKWIWRK